VVDFRTAALLLAIALIAIGLYRLYEDLRPRAPAPPPRAPDGPGESARKARGARVAPAAPAAVAPPVAPAAVAPPAPPPDGRPPAVPVPRISDPGDPDDDITLVVSASKEMLLAREAARGPRPEAAAAEPLAQLGDPTEGDAPREDEQEGEPLAVVPLFFDDAGEAGPPGSVPLVLTAAGRTDQGRRRRRNEDSLLLRPEHHLFVIADGMGGHAGGDVASKLAVERIGAAFAEGEAATPAADLAGLPRSGSELASAVHAANAAIYGSAKKHAAYRGMGTTVVCARFAPLEPRLYVGHVGDSRCYRLRAGALTQITTDHTLGAQGVMGPMASQLERAVGAKPSVRVDVIVASPRPDDVYLLCSDGLSKMVPDPDIQAILLARRGLDEVVRELVDQANARGGRDNITVIVVEVKAASPAPDTRVQESASA
jgi:protein phosphatase